MWKGRGFFSFLLRLEQVCMGILDRCSQNHTLADIIMNRRFPHCNEVPHHRHPGSAFEPGPILTLNRPLQPEMGPGPNTPLDDGEKIP